MSLKNIMACGLSAIFLSSSLSFAETVDLDSGHPAIRGTGYSRTLMGVLNKKPVAPSTQGAEILNCQAMGNVNRRIMILAAQGLYHEVVVKRGFKEFDDALLIGLRNCGAPYTMSLGQ